jgi:hypothetical protein
VVIDLASPWEWNDDFTDVSVGPGTGELAILRIENGRLLFYRPRTMTGLGSDGDFSLREQTRCGDAGAIDAISCRSGRSSRPCPRRARTTRAGSYLLDDQVGGGQRTAATACRWFRSARLNTDPQSESRVGAQAFTSGPATSHQPGAVAQQQPRQR